MAAEHGGVRRNALAPANPIAVSTAGEPIRVDGAPYLIEVLSKSHISAGNLTLTGAV
jgi:hypothetical protein